MDGEKSSYYTEIENKLKETSSSTKFKRKNENVSVNDTNYYENNIELKLFPNNDYAIQWNTTVCKKEALKNNKHKNYYSKKKRKKRSSRSQFRHENINYIKPNEKDNHWRNVYTNKYKNIKSNKKKKKSLSNEEVNSNSFNNKFNDKDCKDITSIDDNHSQDTMIHNTETKINISFDIKEASFPVAKKVRKRNKKQKNGKINTNVQVKHKVHGNPNEKTTTKINNKFDINQTKIKKFTEKLLRTIRSSNMVENKSTLHQKTNIYLSNDNCELHPNASTLKDPTVDIMQMNISTNDKLTNDNYQNISVIKFTSSLKKDKLNVTNHKSIEQNITEANSLINKKENKLISRKCSSSNMLCNNTGDNYSTEKLLSDKTHDLTLPIKNNQENISGHRSFSNRFESPLHNTHENLTYLYSSLPKNININIIHPTYPLNMKMQPNVSSNSSKNNFNNMHTFKNTFPCTNIDTSFSSSQTNFQEKNLNLIKANEQSIQNQYFTKHSYQYNKILKRNSLEKNHPVEISPFKPFTLHTQSNNNNLYSSKYSLNDIITPSHIKTSNKIYDDIKYFNRSNYTLNKNVHVIQPGSNFPCQKKQVQSNLRPNIPLSFSQQTFDKNKHNYNAGERYIIENQNFEPYKESNCHQQTMSFFNDNNQNQGIPSPNSLHIPNRNKVNEIFLSNYEKNNINLTNDEQVLSSEYNKKYCMQSKIKNDSNQNALNMSKRASTIHKKNELLQERLIQKLSHNNYKNHENNIHGLCNEQIQNHQNNDETNINHLKAFQSTNIKKISLKSKDLFTPFTIENILRLTKTENEKDYSQKQNESDNLDKSKKIQSQIPQKIIDKNAISINSTVNSFENKNVISGKQNIKSDDPKTNTRSILNTFVKNRKKKNIYDPIPNPIEDEIHLINDNSSGILPNPIKNNTEPIENKNLKKAPEDFQNKLKQPCDKTKNELMIFIKLCNLLLTQKTNTIDYYTLTYMHKLLTKFVNESYFESYSYSFIREIKIFVETVKNDLIHSNIFGEKMNERSTLKDSLNKKFTEHSKFIKTTEFDQLFTNIKINKYKINKCVISLIDIVDNMISANTSNCNIKNNDLNSKFINENEMLIKENNTRRNKKSETILNGYKYINNNEINNYRRECIQAILKKKEIAPNIVKASNEPTITYDIEKYKPNPKTEKINLYPNINKELISNVSIKNTVHKNQINLQNKSLNIISQKTLQNPIDLTTLTNLDITKKSINKTESNDQINVTTKKITLKRKNDENELNPLKRIRIENKNNKTSKNITSTKISDKIYDNENQCLDLRMNYISKNTHHNTNLANQTIQKLKSTETHLINSNKFYDIDVLHNKQYEKIHTNFIKKNIHYVYDLYKMYDNVFLLSPDVYIVYVKHLNKILEKYPNFKFLNELYLFITSIQICNNVAPFDFKNFLYRLKQGKLDYYIKIYNHYKM